MGQIGLGFGTGNGNGMMDGMAFISVDLASACLFRLNLVK